MTTEPMKRAFRITLVKNSKEPPAEKWTEKGMVFQRAPAPSFFEKANCGFMCNEEAGVVGVDLDCYKWSEEQWALWPFKDSHFDTYLQNPTIYSLLMPF